MNPKYKPNLLASAIVLACSAPVGAAGVIGAAADEVVKPDSVLPADGSPEALELGDTHVIGTAEQELKQASGVSIITAEDLKKRPPVNDISEIVRKMPGVNLTGNSTTGSRGNNRQIDLRGMGPENTLILIDGKPVTSRNSVRMTRTGERDTRGDSNWVPAEMIERIEVLRGPAAARYGSGSMGGVVNIITKRPTDKLQGSITAYTNLPEDDAEGVTKRTNFSLAGPLTDALSFRVYGNLNKTDADDLDINWAKTDAAAAADGISPTYAAGREGVRNKDINGLLSWRLDEAQTIDFEAGYSRQGNIYAGDTGGDAINDSAALQERISALYGRETNTLYRQTYSITHQGDWAFGTSKLTAQYEGTQNRRLQEGLSGGSDGNINADASEITSDYDSFLVSGEVNIPLEMLVHQVLTIGAEWNRQTLDDPSALNQTVSGAGSGGSALPNSVAGSRPTDMDATIAAVFIEDNIELTPDWMLTPGVRLDHHDQFGSNWSPSLNTSYKLTPDITLKGGIARAFKAPNLYQSNPNYLLFSMGMGCDPTFNLGGGCYILGNDSLEPEVSVNKEIGISFDRDGWSAGLTYFRNDYDNKITSGITVRELATGGTNASPVLRWENATDAVVKGWEGNLTVPLLGERGETLSWSTNFTYMDENADRTGQPLSVIPEYTINSFLDWQATDKLALNLNATWYGKQEPRTLNPTLPSSGPITAANALSTRDPYHLWGVGGSYEFSKNLSVGAGINNLFDKRMYREGQGTSQGANTYNEPGRSFYASVTASF